ALRHVPRVGVAARLGQRRGVVGRDVGLLGRCLLGRLLLVLGGGILRGGVLRSGRLLRGLVGDVLRGGLRLLGGLLRAGGVVGVVAAGGHERGAARDEDEHDQGEDAAAQGDVQPRPALLRRNRRRLSRRGAVGRGAERLRRRIV